MNTSRLKYLIISGLVGLLSVLPSRAAMIGDSVNDFSAVQGADGWTYGYYPSYNLTPSGFLQLAYFDAAVGAWMHSEPNEPPWTQLRAGLAHPSGWGRIEYAVRRFTYDGDDALMHITGHLAKADTGGGDGVVGQIIVDGVLVYSQAVAYNDAIGYDFSVCANVHDGSLIDFVVTPLSYNDWNDSTTFTAKLYVPEAGSSICLLLMGTGALWSLARRWRGR